MPSRLSTYCENCIHKDDCDSKRMAACAYLGENSTDYARLLEQYKSAYQEEYRRISAVVDSLSELQSPSPSPAPAPTQIEMEIRGIAAKFGKVVAT